MYNRYIRNDQGVYTRIPEEEPQSPAGASAPPPPNQAPETPPSFGPPPEPGSQPPPSWESGGDGISGTLRRLLEQFRLGDLDSGDLLLLAILWFLFREGADEEVLAALGLLLIL